MKVRPILSNLTFREPNLAVIFEVVAIYRIGRDRRSLS